MGQNNFEAKSAAATQNGLSNPTGVACDSAGGRLFVADTGNNRVLVYDTIGMSNGQDATAVLGQTTYVASTAATTQNGLDNPGDLSFDSVRSYLFVADTNNSRILVFDTAAITTGENAINVLGQSGFTAAIQSNGVSRFMHPSAVFFNSTLNRLLS